MSKKIIKYDENSSLRSILYSPLGKDIITRILAQFNKSIRLINNPIAGLIKLKHLPKLSKGMITKPDINNITALLNSSLTEKYIPSGQTYETERWWKETAVYQIYPRSFMDSNGDGIGDINGIISKLDYLKNLGIGTVWLSPVYASPNDDNGYDISDYRKIMKEFGTMKDFDRLLSEVHSRDMRLIMDLVINHTSDEHDWFKKAQKGDKKYQDYYHRVQSGKNPPNNWGSMFSGSAWNYYEKTDDWYLHLFSKKQMDLNWENPDMRAELYDMINWWLDKGVDGFRLDVISFISKKTGLPDGMDLFKKFGVAGVEHYFSGPRLHEFLRELNNETFSKYNCFTVGETPILGLEAIKLTTAENRKELNTAFSFDHLDCPGKMKWDNYSYNLAYLKKTFNRNQLELNNGVWNTLFFENHDNPRMTTKIDRTNKYRNEIAKMLGLMQCTLKGTPFIYQGQELGMINGTFGDISEFKDVESVNYYDEKINSGTSAEEALNIVRTGSRDHARMPMQWTSDGGFTTGVPWLKQNDDCAVCNAKSQTTDSGSVYSFYRILFGLRKSTPALIYGKYLPVKTSDKKYCYIREYGNEKYYIEINLTANSLPRVKKYKSLLSSYNNTDAKLRPYEAIIYKM